MCEKKDINLLPIKWSFAVFKVSPLSLDENILTLILWTKPGGIPPLFIDG